MHERKVQQIRPVAPEPKYESYHLKGLKQEIEKRPVAHGRAEKAAPRLIRGLFVKRKSGSSVEIKEQRDIRP
jgi:hypothetical protein